MELNTRSLFAVQIANGVTTKLTKVLFKEFFTPLWFGFNRSNVLLDLYSLWHYNIHNSKRHKAMNFQKSRNFRKFYSCIQCEIGMVPNIELKKCHPITPIHLDWNSAWAIIPATFSIMGFISTIFVIFVFMQFNYTPVVWFYLYTYITTNN